MFNGLEQEGTGSEVSQKAIAIFYHKEFLQRVLLMVHGPILRRASKSLTIKLKITSQEFQLRQTQVQCMIQLVCSNICFCWESLFLQMPKAVTTLPSLSLCHAVSLNRPTSGFNDHGLKRNLSGELEKMEKLVFGGMEGEYVLPQTI